VRKRNNFLDGRGGGEGELAKSDDGEKAWSSLIHLVHGGGGGNLTVFLFSTNPAAQARLFLFHRGLDIFSKLFKSVCTQTDAGKIYVSPGERRVYWGGSVTVNACE
jgi:hypothetical protein